MTGGSTVVLSLTRPENRDNPQPEDEQFHVLPQYEPDATSEELQLKEKLGGLESLKSFQRTIVIREPGEKKSLRGKPSVEKKKLLDGALPSNYSPSPKKLPRKQSPKKKLPPLDLNDFSKFETQNLGKSESNSLENNNIENNNLENSNAPLDLTFSAASQHLSPTLPSQPVVGPPQFQLEERYYQAQPPPSLTYPGAVYSPYQPNGFYYPQYHLQHLQHLQHHQLPGAALYYPGQGFPHQQLQNLNQLENLFSPEMLSLLDPPSPPRVPQLDGTTEEVNDVEESPVEVKKEVKFETELELAEKSELKALVKYETDCSDAIQDPDVGGLALALPHGSLLVEVAKHELHATTALRAPNKMNPCRVGLVFYQHGNLHLPQI